MPNKRLLLTCKLSLILLLDSWNAFRLSIAFSPLPRSGAGITRTTSTPSSSSTLQKQQIQGTFPTSLSSQAPTTIGIALTREEGKNEKLRKEIMKQFNRTQSMIHFYELPCIAHADGPDAGNVFSSTLEEIQQEQETSKSFWDYVVVTSPEAAKVLASVWTFDSPDNIVPPKVAAVGAATQKALEKTYNIPVSFVPSKATAATLAVELPPVNNNDITRVLYPASCKAPATLQNGLHDRQDASFQVTRLNTYDTVAATWGTTLYKDDDASPDDETPSSSSSSSTLSMQQVANTKTQIACFGSPSAVKGWIQNTMLQRNNDNMVWAACIGETSAKECRQQGWPESKIVYPKKQPGVAGWAKAVCDILTSIQEEEEQ